MTRTNINIYLKVFLFNMFPVLFIGSIGSSFAQESKIQNSENGLEQTKDQDSEFNEAYDNFSFKDAGDVLSVINAPGHNCQGLTWHGENLWVSDCSSKTIFQIDTIDGTVLNSFPAPGYFGEGLAWDGEYLFLCDNGSGNEIPDFIYRIDPSDGSILYTLALETMDWPHGITWDGQNLWINNFMTHTITKIDYETGQVLHSIPAPGDKSWGLTWDGEHLWANDTGTDLLYCLSPVDGTVIYTVPAPADNIRDLAFDGVCLWVVSANESKIYRIDIGNSNGLDASSQEVSSITAYPNPFSESITISYRINQPSEVSILITDCNGKLISILESQQRNPGNYQVIWKGNSDRKIDVPAGIYFCSLKTDYTWGMIKIVKGY